MKEISLEKFNLAVTLNRRVCVCVCVCVCVHVCLKICIDFIFLSADDYGTHWVLMFQCMSPCMLRRIGAGNGQNLTTRLMKDAYRLKKMDKLNFSPIGKFF